MEDFVGILIVAAIALIAWVFKKAKEAASRPSADREDHTRATPLASAQGGGAPGRSELQAYLEALKSKRAAQEQPRAPAPETETPEPEEEEGESTTRSVFAAEAEAKARAREEAEEARRRAVELAEQSRRKLYRGLKQERRKPVRPAQVEEPAEGEAPAAPLAAPLTAAPAVHEELAVASAASQGPIVLDAGTLRRAVLMMEVLGPPRAVRPHGYSGDNF